jgi:ATP-binding cassette subfamily B protein
MLLTLAFDLVRPFLLKIGLEHITHKNLSGLHTVALVFLAAILLEYLSRSNFDFFLTVSFLETIYRVRNDVFHHILGLKMAYLDKTPVGTLVNKTLHDTESLSESLRAGLATILVDILTILGVLWVMAKLELSLLPIMAITSVVVLWMARWFGRKVREQYLKIRAFSDQVDSFTTEAIHGLEVIRLFQFQEESAHKLAQLNKAYRQATIWENVYEASFYSMIEAMSAALSAAILYWGFGIRFGLVEVTNMVVYLNLVDRIFVPLRELGGKFATIQQATASLQRILGLIHSPQHISSGHKSLESDSLHIEFANVSFSYKEGDEQTILKNISFQIEPGQTVALVGATGSGKSTIGKLLIRAYDGYTGHIYINGMELREIHCPSLRSKIAIVQQEMDVFPGTIRDNISMFDHRISDHQIYQAISLVKARDIIANLPGQLDFRVEENGSNLSTGQVQLILFARALARDAPLLVMDEATSSVDSVTEAWIQKALQEIFKFKTVLIVAHRLSTVAAAHKILVLKEGCILQQGTHQELLADTKAYYAQLVQSSQIKSKW